MANALYAKYKEQILNAGLNLSGSTIQAVLVDTNDYTVDLANDQWLSDIDPTGRVGVPQTLSTKLITGGRFDADDLTFSTVTGDQCEALVIYETGASEATSQLIAYIDTAVGLPVTPNSGDITVTWGQYIFQL